MKRPNRLAAAALLALLAACAVKHAAEAPPKPSLPANTRTMPRLQPAPAPSPLSAPAPEQERLRALGYDSSRDQGAVAMKSYRGVAQAPTFAAVGRADGAPATIAPRPGEELWVIARSDAAPAPPADDAVTAPALRAKPPGAQTEVPLPLTHTDVRATVSGYLARVRVVQQYQNPYAEKIEAVYVFPLPQDAAVNEFVMTIGPRRIRGIIREREEAEQIYADARQQGYVASLLTQERPNVFTQSVANIEPGKAIDVELTYFNPLAFHDGEYELVFPMVVGPRFNPSGTANGIGAVAHGDHGASGQPTEVQYLPPGQRSGHDISLRVDIDAGMPVESIASPSHRITTSAPSASRRRIELDPADTVPNKDFVLRYRLAGEQVKTALLAHQDTRGGFFTLMLQPPETLRGTARAPMELIFVLDCSGSMSGAPLDIAKGAAERALRRLGSDDTFQIVQFSTTAAQLGPKPIPATEANLARGIEYLRSLQSEGGTTMIEGIKASLDFPHDPRRLRVVSFMTDGYIGNEAEILGEIQQRLGDARIFSFGIGSSTNRYLLDRMALLGRGAVAYVGLDETSQRAVDQFYERVSHPALTDLRIDWGGMQVSGVYPERIPDLFFGRPVVISGRFSGPLPDAIRIDGRAGGEPHRLTLQVDPGAGGGERPELASLWARMRIADLEDRATVVADPEIPREIEQVALEYGLMSAYTAFVAVDASARTAGEHGTSVAVPVPMPDGVRYDTTVPEGRAQR